MAAIAARVRAMSAQIDALQLYVAEIAEHRRADLRRLAALGLSQRAIAPLVDMTQPRVCQLARADPSAAGEVAVDVEAGADGGPLRLQVFTAEHVGRLTHFALDKLWESSPDALPGHEDYIGCCPQCCSPCGSLQALAASGELEQCVLAWPAGDPAGSAWWDADNQRVDRAWLQRSWSHTDMMECHEPA